MVIRSGMGTITCSRWAKAFSISLRLLVFFWSLYPSNPKNLADFWGSELFFFFLFLSFFPFQFGTDVN